MRDFITGVRYFWRGLGLLVRRPKLLLIGMFPAVLTTVILLGGMVALIVNVGHLAALVTPFANGWSGGEREVARVAAGLALVGGAVLLGLVAFTAVTLVVGGPFYEHIAERIEDDLGVTGGYLEPESILRQARQGRARALVGMDARVAAVAERVLGGAWQRLAPRAARITRPEGLRQTGFLLRVR
jgi:uncharacterized protein involved in cysteine biosynthesis